MNREVHVRFRERLRGKFPRATRPPVPQLDPGSGKTKKAYLWAYRSNDLEPGPKIVVFDYQAGRSGEHARQFLGTWQGHLLVDDYTGYKACFPVNANKHRLARNWAAGRIRVGSFSTCTKPMPALWQWRR